MLKLLLCDKKIFTSYFCQNNRKSLKNIFIFLQLHTFIFEHIWLSFINCWQPERHICASRCQHHILGIKLNTLNRTWMIRIQNTHFITCIGIPNMDATIRWSAKYKLRIGTEGCLYGYSFIIQMSRECLQWSAVECIDYLIIEPFLLIYIVLPSRENFNPVQSHSFSWVSLKVTKGP